MPGEASGEPECVSRIKDLVERCCFVDVQIVLHKLDELGFGILFRQAVHEMGVFERTPSAPEMNIAFAGVDVVCQKGVNDTVPLVLVVFAHHIARSHRQWDNHIADNLTWTLIVADARVLWIRFLAVKMEDVLHAGDIHRRQFADTPLFLLMRLERIFFNTA